MSKGNMLLGQARGKVGDVVFYVRNGIQQTRPRNRQPQNPQTRAQMTQRVKMAAPVLFYKRNKDFFAYAYKKKQNESYYNAFIRYNINIAPYLTREQVVDGIKVPAPYIIADGNLTPVNVYSVETVNTNLKLNTTINANLIKTWGDFRREYGLNYGDMMTIVAFATQGATSPVLKRITEQHVFDVTSDSMPIGYDMGNTSWYTQSDRYYIQISSESYGLPEWDEVGAAIVLSSNRGGIDCSFAQLTLSDFAQSTYEDMRSDYQLALAIASYSDQSNAILDPQNADDNLAEFMQVYDDSSTTIPINEITLTANDGIQVFYDSQRTGTVSSVSSSVLSGNIVGVSISKSTDNAIEIASNSTAAGSGVYMITLKSSSGAAVGKIIIPISVTE